MDLKLRYAAAMQPEEHKKIPASFCPAPFQSFVQDYNGQCGPCPYQAGAWDFKKLAFEDRWSAPAVENLRREHLSGVKSAVCQRCYIEEEAGFRSRRIAENEWNPLSFQKLKSGAAQAGLETMVLRLSNSCNYACRTCHSVDSSLFKKEGEYYAETYGDLGNRYIEREARAEFTAEQMHELCKLTSSLRELQFYGGEPMLNKTHHILLEHLIEQGRAGEVALFYCTNASIYPSAPLIALWKQFRAVHMHFSLDAVGDPYHYVRWPGSWSKVSSHIDRFRRELAPEFHGRLTFGSNTTVSSINVFDLPEIYASLENLFGSRAALTTVHDPAYFSIVNLPGPIKEKIRQKLLGSPHAGQFSGIVDFMLERELSEPQFRDFVHWTEKMDAYRKVKFAEYFPAYFKVLQPFYERHAKTALRKKSPLVKELKSQWESAGQMVSASASNFSESIKDLAQAQAKKSWLCTNPWSQAVIDARGRVKPCARFQVGEKFSRKVTSEPLEDILNSPEYRDLRREMNAGEFPAGCEKCRAEESAGLPSLREKANGKNPPSPKSRTRISHKEISSLEFFLGNECNLKCLTCDPQHSSSIFAEQKNRGIITAPAPESDLSLVRKLAPNLRAVKITGGEPFLMPRHLELLRLLSEEGDPHSISLAYNTNGTIFPSPEVLELWKAFRSVKVAISVDGTGKLNEYIRHPSSWETVAGVARQYAQLAAQEQNFRFSAICTVSAYNLRAIPEVMAWWKNLSEGADRLSPAVNLNFVRYPEHLSAHVLTASLKEEACFSLAAQNPEIAQQVRSFVFAEDKSDLLEKFRSYTRQMDRIRGQSVEKAIPALRSIFAESALTVSASV